jgi:hypothetical protein
MEHAYCCERARQSSACRWQVSKPRDSEAKIRQQAGVQGLEIDVILSENNLLLMVPMINSVRSFQQ